MRRAGVAAALAGLAALLLLLRDPEAVERNPVVREPAEREASPRGRGGRAATVPPPRPRDGPAFAVVVPRTPESVHLVEMIPDVRIHLRDVLTGLPVNEVVRCGVTDSRDWGTVTRGPVVGLPLPEGRFLLDIAAEGYVPVEGFAVDVLAPERRVELTLHLTPDPGAWAQVDLVVTDDADAPVTTLHWSRFGTGRSEESADGRYSLRLVAGRHSLVLGTPKERIDRMEPSWLGRSVLVTVERGARAEEHVRLKRAGFLRVRCDPPGALSDLEVYRNDQALRLQRSPREDGFVALLEPGIYEVTGTREGCLHHTDVEVRPHEVVEAWLRPDR